MNDDGGKFDPLSDKERKTQIPSGGKDKPTSQIVLPVPANAPPPPRTHPSLGAPSRIDRYLNAAGEALHDVCRFEPRRPGERKIILPLTCRLVAGGALFWAWLGYPSDHLLPLFGLDKLAANPGAVVLFVEGEKSAEAGRKLFEGDTSIVAVSTMGGVTALHRADLEPVRGRPAMIWPDNDEPGRQFSKGLADRLVEMDCDVSIIDPLKIIEKHGQGLDPDGLDVADLALSPELAVDVRAFAVPYAGDPLKGLDKAEPAAIDAFVAMMQANPKLRPDAGVLQALAAMPDFDSLMLLDRLLKVGVTKTATNDLKGKMKAARKERNRKPPIDPTDFDPTKMLLVDRTNPHQTARAAFDFIVKGGEVYHNVVEGRMVRLSRKFGEATATIAMNNDGLRIVLHNACRPYAIEQEGGTVAQIDCEVPDTILRSIMNYYGSARLRPLRGISAAPRLLEDGTIDCSRGYDERLGVFFEGVEGLEGRIPPKVTEQNAKDALRRIRHAFRPLPYSDAITVTEGKFCVVDLDQPPRIDESVFLTQLLGAAIRASIKHCPGLLIGAARHSGSGSGKGLAARCLIIVSLRRTPGTYPKNESTQNEIDKTLVTALRDGPSFLFLDNYNNIQIASAILEGVLTEEARARILGVSQSADLSASVFVIITGNSVGVRGDTVRRIVETYFDAGVENPSERDFSGWDLQGDVTRDRDAILADLLTIWRWGRQNKIAPGMPVGTFVEWAQQARDPLVSLGCADAAITMRQNAANDPSRENEINVYRTWWTFHQDEKITSSMIDHEVLEAIGSKCIGKNVTYYLKAKIGQRIGGFVLRHELGKTVHHPALYWLELTGPEPPKQEKPPPPEPDPETVGWERE